MKKPTGLTQKTLKEILNYDPDTGVFKNAIERGSAKVGNEAGGIDTYGYRVITIENKTYKAHRLAFLYMTGEFPPADIDHQDGDKSNNRWLNLRSATTRENGRNRKRNLNNSTGSTGIYRDAKRGKWLAQIRADKTNIHLGYFDDFDQALSARKLAENRYGYHRNHGRVGS